MRNIYRLSRTIHRWCVLTFSVLGVAMAFTGLVLKYPFVSSFLPLVNPANARLLHNTISPLFGILLSIVTITGLYMFMYPYLQKIIQTRKNELESDSES